MHFLLHIILSALDNIQKLGIVLILYSRIAHIANNLGLSSLLIFGGGVIQCLLTCPRTYQWGQLYEILIFSEYISHKKEIKVNYLTPDYGQNLIYPILVLKFEPKEPKLF